MDRQDCGYYRRVGGSVNRTADRRRTEIFRDPYISEVSARKGINFSAPAFVIRESLTVRTGRRTVEKERRNLRRGSGMGARRIGVDMQYYSSRSTHQTRTPARQLQEDVRPRRST